MCVACLTSQNFSCFALPMQAVPETPAGFKVSTRFGRVLRKPILLGLAPSKPAPFYSSLCPPSCPTLSHALNPLTFFFLLSPTFCPSFRVIWWNQTLFLGGPRSPLKRSAPPIISLIPTSNNPPRETVSFLRRSLFVCRISNFDPPF